MGKPVFKLRVKPTSNAREEVRREILKKREEKFTLPVEWCKEKGRGDGLHVYKRIDGDLVTGAEKEYCSVLTVDEEEMIVRHAKNKNRYKNFIIQDFGI